MGRNDRSYAEIENDLREQASDFATRARGCPGAVGKREWLEAAEHALAGAAQAKLADAPPRRRTPAEIGRERRADQ